MTDPADPTGDPAAAPRVVVQGPVPSPEEAAAIVAAVQVGLGGGAEPPRQPEPPRWRFSGRWWSKPVPLRRERPS